MKHNRKRREAEARLSRRPDPDVRGAAPVDPSRLGPSHCWNPPEFLVRGLYVDQPFTCASCGRDQVWSATQQKWWYEVAKGSPYSEARRCRDCRREARQHKGRAHPLRDLGRWLRLLRDELEPPLLAHGWFPLVGFGESHPALLAYGRGDVVLRLRASWLGSRYALILDRCADLDASPRTLAQVEIDPSGMTPPELQRRFDGFLEAARRKLDSPNKPRRLPDDA